MTTPAVPGVNSGFLMPDAASPSELFALTDEQILEIDPVGESAVIPSEARNLSSVPDAAQTLQSKRDSSVALLSRNYGTQDSSQGTAQSSARAATEQSQPSSHQATEPPPWLAAQMRDPWSGDEARELWNGVQQARQEAAAYREVFAKPEDARALKQLYPGGVEQARATAERARTLEEIDSAFYGGAGKSPEQLSAGRTALAQRMLREDPAAFREMVFAGLRALEEAGTSTRVEAPSRSGLSVNSHGTGSSEDGPDRVVGAATAPEHPGNQRGAQTESAVARTHAAVDPAYANQYAAFEKSANEELERSVGGAINRAIEQALPNSRPGDTGSSAGARYSVPLQQRLGGVIREEVESALKGDRQLGEQIAQVLSARRFDDTTRAQVVRLINDRAQQLIPTAAKRVLQDWTQTTFAAHRGSIQRGNDTRSPADATNGAAQFAGNRVVQSESAPVTNGVARNPAGISAKAAAADRAEKAAGLSTRTVASQTGRASRVDYRKLSDEQILEL